MRSPTLSDTWAELRPSFGPGTAAAIMFAVFVLADLVAGRLHMSGLPGFGFAAGSAAAAGWTRRRGLLVVVTTPPVIFIGAITCAELITMHLSHVALSVTLLAANVFLTLGAAAPWMLAGLAGALVIAIVRGLPQAIRDLRVELLGRTMRDYYR